MPCDFRSNSNKFGKEEEVKVIERVVFKERPNVLQMDRQVQC